MRHADIISPPRSDAFQAAESAMDAARATLRTPNGDVLDMGKYLLVWKRIDGEWYAAALSFTSDAAAPVPIKGK